MSSVTDKWIPKGIAQVQQDFQRAHDDIQPVRQAEAQETPVQPPHYQMNAPALTPSGVLRYTVDAQIMNSQWLAQQRNQVMERLKKETQSPHHQERGPPNLRQHFHEPSRQR